MSNKDIKIFIVGIDGKMGRTVCSRAEFFDGFCVAGGFDTIPDMDFKVFTDVKSVDIDYDVVVDFSRPESLETIIALTAKSPRPVVLATTGYSDKELVKIKNLAKKIPVFMSGNMSWGIHVMQKLVSEAVKNLWDSFDVEIIEKHHNQKVDAPSGTAKMIAETVKASATTCRGCAQDQPPVLKYGREGVDARRIAGDVTLHAVRGGTIVGEHEVIFAGDDEIITITHSALSRTIFADGVLRAAKFLISKAPNLYTMQDMLV